MEEKNKKIAYFLAINIILGVGTAGWLTLDQLPSFFTRNNHQQASSTIETNAQPEEWITVFVHGTFSCLLSLFSLPAVLSDAVGKTLYKELANAQRKNPANYLDQAMLQRGLVKIQPTYDLRITNGQRFSAYPLAQAFLDFSHYSKHNNQINTFYTFGWSGLLSQKQRRIEAVRFYNELTRELECFHKVGKRPKIRLIAHSHGGNLCLNLAAINDVLSLSSYEDIEHATSDQATNQALITMFDYIKKLPNKEQVAKAKRLKYLDHVPIMRITIDELILLGTPIQVETEPFFYSPTFKKIYHFYSGEDGIQPLDFVSSKKASLRKITYTTAGLPKIRAFPTLIQSKIIINRSHKNNRSKKYAVTHKDLWGISWHKNDNPLTPLPIFVLTPLLTEALDSQQMVSHENEIKIKLTNTHLEIHTKPQGTQKVASIIQIKRNKFEEVKKNVRHWDPYHKVKV